MRGATFAIAVALAWASAAWAADADAGAEAAVDAGVVPDAGPAEPVPEASDGPQDAGPTASVEAFAPVEAFTPAAPVPQFEPPPSGPEVRLFASLSALAALDTRFESPRGAELSENVAELSLRARLGADVKVSEHVRAYVEARAWLRAVTERDFDRAKAFLEPQLGEAYVDFYSPRVDVRVGNQRVVLGASPVASPVDVFNPRELRESFLFAEPDVAAVPVPAVKATGEYGAVSYLAAYAPFFIPSRYALFGQDEGLLQPALAPAIPFRRVDPTVEDALQPHLSETRRPLPFLGDLALSAAYRARVTVRASWAWVNEKLPQVTIDPELSRLLQSQAEGQMVDPALALSVQSRLSANETLFTGTYARQHVLALSATALLGPGQLDVDVAYSPRQTFFDVDFSPLNKASFTAVATYALAEDSPWQWSVTAMAMVVPDVHARERLALLEPPTATGVDRTVFFPLLIAQLGRTFLDGRLSASLRAAFEPFQQSLAISPKVAWLGVEGLELFAGAEFYEGPPYSAFGYFGRNDRVVLGATWTPW